MAERPEVRKKALRFVVLIGVMSLFADFAYEGARSIQGPFLKTLNASGMAVAIVAGFGEFLGYGLRMGSGWLADRTRRFWPITIFGYVVQMAAVPALALAGSWPVAALLITLERVGKAVRNPPRDVMLSNAGKQIGGYGWAFGLKEGLDQIGALAGPLVVAVVIAWKGDYRMAFAALAVPAAATLLVLGVARLLYPRPEEMESHPPEAHTAGLPRVFWIYLAGAALVAAGFVDFPLIAFHFEKASIMRTELVPVFYAVAMGTDGLGALVFGRLFDRRGLGILVPLTIVSAAFAPLVFLGGVWTALAGAAIWGLGMGVHESIVGAAVAPMVRADRRASAYGVFSAAYGLFWFLGSALLGVLYDAYIPALIAVSVGLQLASIPFFVRAAGLMRRQQTT